MDSYKLTYDTLLADLRRAYHDARRHKRSRRSQLDFEAQAGVLLPELCKELMERSYSARPSTCFIINDPKKREIFAADFRDRIVHHLYYNYTHQMLERTFIQDSYSCIKGRGTHYGIRRLEQFIRRESQNYTERCYVLKMDIRGYFMSIDRQRLSEICCRRIKRMAGHRIARDIPEKWRQVTDIDFVLWLTKEIAMLNPTRGCVMKGSPADWHGLPHSKSLFHSPAGCGLPIGNLTSQLFSNVYLGELDDYMKRELGCRSYGRYVDDFYVVNADREWLRSLIPQVRRFLADELGLTLHDGKTRICDVRQGVDYLGAYLKPWRLYISSQTLRRIRPKVEQLWSEPYSQHRNDCMASYKGLLSHYRSLSVKTNLWVCL